MYNPRQIAARLVTRQVANRVTAKLTDEQVVLITEAQETINSAKVKLDRMVQIAADDFLA